MKIKKADCPMKIPPLDGKELFDYLQKLVTESPNPQSRELDRLDTLQILELINSEDATVAIRVNQQIPQIAKAVEMAYRALSTNGRLIYIGAGTSGRLGVLDAAECPPTFGIAPDKIVGLIAGGAPTLVRSAEGVEDDIAAGEMDIDNLNVGESDVVMGLTASQRTPYVIAGLNRAQSRKAKTIFLTCNPSIGPDCSYDLVINPVVGPEVLTGSTRMKAALAEKMVLTMITTSVMVKLGKVYNNMMVDLQATSQKLVERSKKVIMAACGCEYEAAGNYLKNANGHVKTAIIMAKLGCDLITAKRRLDQAGGFIYKVFEN
jgi:N-acetylmuramic acid 6-phosphate etherase